MNKAIKKMASVIMAVVMFVSVGVTAISVGAQGMLAANSDFVGITPFASDVLSSWTPLLSKSNFGANISLRNFYSGSVTVELRNSSNTLLDSTANTFSNQINISPKKNRTIASGSYKIVISIDIPIIPCQN